MDDHQEAIPTPCTAPNARPPSPSCASSSRQDQIGAAGLVAEYFAADKPEAISSRHPRWTIKKKNKRDPDTAFGNNRGVPVPTFFQEDVLKVGGLRFEVDRADIHQTGDYLIYLNKDTKDNASEGMAECHGSYIFT